MDNSLLELILDNIPEGIYVLDGKGNYIFANSAYIDLIKMDKSELLTYNVKDFLREKVIDISISDVVYKQRRRVAMLQDIFSGDGKDRLRRQLVISTPIFNDKGEINNIVAIVRALETMNDYYYQAQEQSVSSFVINKTKRVPLDFIAESPAMQSLVESAAAVSRIDSAILINGESGTGKEVLAQYIHDSGTRSQKPFVVVNCASLPSSLLEAELFGYEKGAFTGALATGRKGYFEEADGGTVFLDEINSLPLDMQGKLLRAVETKQIQRVGSTKSKAVDFRIIAASNENLSALVESKRFRADLFYRLNVIPLNIPPLRERPEDICPLAEYFLRRFCKKYSKNSLFSQAALNAMLSYLWPGNVRELKNFVERSVIMSMEGNIEIHDIESLTDGPIKSSKPIQDKASPADFKVHNFSQMLDSGVTLNDYIKDCGNFYVNYALKRYPNSYLAAAALGTSQSSVMRRKKKKHNM